MPPRGVGCGRGGRAAGIYGWPARMSTVGVTAWWDDCQARDPLALRVTVRRSSRAARFHRQLHRRRAGFVLRCRRSARMTGPARRAWEASACDPRHSERLQRAYLVKSVGVRPGGTLRDARTSPESPALRPGALLDPCSRCYIPSPSPSSFISRERAFVPVPPTLSAIRPSTGMRHCAADAVVRGPASWRVTSPCRVSYPWTTKSPPNALPGASRQAHAMVGICGERVTQFTRSTPMASQRRIRRSDHDGGVG